MRKTKFILARVNEEQIKLIKKAANIQGLTIAAFCRQSSINSARQIINNIKN